MRRTPRKPRQHKDQTSATESGNRIKEAIQIEALGLMFSASRLMENARQLGRGHSTARAFGRRPTRSREQCRDLTQYRRKSAADLS